MKKIIKNNWMMIIPLLILIIWYAFALGKFVNWFYDGKQIASELYTECQKNSKSNSDICSESKEYLDGFEMPPAPLLYTYIISGDSMENFNIVVIMFVAIPAIYPFYRDIKGGMYKNKLTREKYMTFFKKHYKNSMKYLIILPLFLIMTFLITCIISKFKLQYQASEIELFGNFWSSRPYGRSLWIPYFLTMLYATITHSIYYINTAYLMFYKVKNFIVNIVATYLCYLISQIIIMKFLAQLAGKYLKNSDLYFSLLDPELWTFGMNVNNYEQMVIASLFYMLSSTVIVIFLYFNKERFVIINGAN